MTDKEITYPLTNLYLYLTDCCNLKCSHCWITPVHSLHQQIGIPLDALKKTVLEAKLLGLNSVKLTGGEPLLYKSLNELTAFLASEELAIYIETNGTLINKDIIKSLKSCNVEQISISLDASSEKIHDRIRGVNGAFYQTLKGIHLLSDYGFNFQVIMTLQRKNRKEVSNVIKLCKKLRAKSLKINHLLPCGRGKQVFNNKQNLEIDELIHLYKMIKEKWSRPGNLEIIFDLPVAFRSIEDIKHKGINECKILNILGILANGDFSICGIGQTVEDLRMGNLLNDSITEIWQNNLVLNDLRQFITKKLDGVCGQCIFKFQCLGGCRANAYALSKDIYAPYFLCQQYFDSGLFPSSRYV